jgi:hypothetical protein
MLNIMNVNLRYQFKTKRNLLSCMKFLLNEDFAMFKKVQRPSKKETEYFQKITQIIATCKLK